jgi:hypothetical protein
MEEENRVHKFSRTLNAIISFVGIVTGAMFGVWALVLYGQFSDIHESVLCHGRVIRVLMLALGIMEIIGPALGAIGLCHSISALFIERQMLGMAILTVINIIGIMLRACISIGTFGVLIALSCYTWLHRCVRLTVSYDTCIPYRILGNIITYTCLCFMHRCWWCNFFSMF